MFTKAGTNLNTSQIMRGVIHNPTFFKDGSIANINYLANGSSLVKKN